MHKMIRVTVIQIVLLLTKLDTLKVFEKKKVLYNKIYSNYR